MSLCKKRGCDDDHDGSIVERVNEVYYRECPLRSAQRTGIMNLSLVSSAWQSNLLPYAGGVLDQPGLAMDAMMIFMHTEAKMTEGKKRG